MKTLTVFTPTYNRAYCLHQLYESLCRQTSNDFEWLIIDDGSTDHTKALVESWIKDGKVKIHYEYKENGGMHTGHNKAYELIETELNVCIDSDDYMPDDAVELILQKWNQIKFEKHSAGIIGLNCFKNGTVVGTAMPDGLLKGTLSDLYQKHNVKGDKKIVLRTSVVKEFAPYPVFENEKLVPLSSLYQLIETKYIFYYTNDVFCVVEYLSDGSTKNIFKQYRISPRGFVYARVIQQKHSKSLIQNLKNAIHIASSSFIANDFKLLLQGNKKLLNVLMLPFGFLLNIYIRFKSNQ
jgi:glycosyltransferase involved in cell wall biosynthesis